MEEYTLQRALKSKYNIDETLQAEGKFVALLNGSMAAISLFSIGIGQRCFVVAGINLSGAEVDYDLISLTPLGLLGLTYLDKNKVIKISSQYKATQAFQLCSSARAPEVWDDFTAAIDYLRPRIGDDIWCSASFTASPASSRSSTNVEFERGSQKASFGGGNLSYTCIPRKMINMSHLGVSTSSLPDTIGASHVTQGAVWSQHIKRGHSFDCVNTSFDSFVNDSHSHVDISSSQMDTCNCSSSVVDRKDKLEKSKHGRKTLGLVDRFRRFLSCCLRKN